MRKNPHFNLQRFNDGGSDEHESDVKMQIVMDEKDDSRGRLNLEGIEFKASTEEKGVIEGYASTFGNLDRQGDIIEKGAFASTRKRIPIFGMHNPREGIGVGTVTEDEKGLKIRIKLAIDNTDSQILRERALEYYAMAKEGIIERMSIGFATLEREWVKKTINGVEKHIRLIKKVDLMETSLVPIPANDLARVTSVKSIDGAEELDKLVEEKTAELAAEITRLTKENEELKAQIQKKESYKSLDGIFAKRLY